MTADLTALETDLVAALTRKENHRRRRRRPAVVIPVALIAAALSTVALACGTAGDLHLDPTQWSILGGGSIDGGHGAYVHAERTSDGSPSTFMVEHDDGLAPYQAFLLHEKTLAAANQTSPTPVRIEPGALCTPSELANAESIAMATLRAQYEPGTDAQTTQATVESAVRSAFGGSECRGLDYAAEQARLVYAGKMPAAKLMPGIS